MVSNFDARTSDFVKSLGVGASNFESYLFKVVVGRFELCGFHVRLLDVVVRTLDVGV